MIKNYGISFGQIIPGMLWLQGGVWLMTCWWLLKSKNWRVGLIVVGGGLNLWQRIQWGYVVDYWRIPMTDVYNNINDWLIFGGVVLYLWQKIAKK